MWVIVQIVCVIPFLGTLGQRITLYRQLTTPCNSSLRSGTDTFAVNGVVVGNVASYFQMGWEETIHIQVVTRAPSEIKNICPIPVSRASCHPDTTLPCYCKEVNATTGEVHFVINYPAVVDLSQGHIRALWMDNSSAVTYSNNITLLSVFNWNAEHLVLTVVGVTGKLSTPGFCNFSITLNKSNTLTLCCSTTSNPCYPQISFSGNVVTDKKCVDYTPASDGVTGTLKLSYSLCTNTDFIKGNSCAVLTKKATTTTEASTSSLVTDASSPFPKSTRSSHAWYGNGTTASTESSSSWRPNVTEPVPTDRSLCPPISCSLPIGIWLFIIGVLVTYFIIWPKCCKKQQRASSPYETTQQPTDVLHEDGRLTENDSMTPHSTAV